MSIGTVIDSISATTIYSGGTNLENIIANYAALGEVNTASNIGSGFGLFKSKSVFDLQFRSLSAGTIVQFLTGDTLTISVSTASTRNNTVVVKSLSDFPSPVGGVIALANDVAYNINGTINIGTNRLFAGTSNTVFGFDKSSDVVIYTGTESLFINNNRDISIRNMTLASVTIGGSVFDFLGTTNKVEIAECIFANCKSLGGIQVGDVVVFRGNLITASQGGLSLSGYDSSSDFVFTDNYMSNDNTGAFSYLDFKSGIVDQITIARNIFHCDAAQTGISVSNMSISGTSVLALNSFGGTGKHLNGFDHTSNKWLFTGNQGIANRQREFFISKNDISGVALTNPTTAAASSFVLPNTGAVFYQLRGGNNQADGISFMMQVPSDYFSGGRFDINLTTQTTANNIILFMALSKVIVGEDFGVLDETNLSVTFAGTTQYQRKEVSITPITSTFASGDIYVIKLWRNPNDVGDVATQACYISNIQFVYNSI
jgi:hypothetical protein